MTIAHTEPLQLAGDTAAEASIPFALLPVWEAAAAALADAETFLAAITEIRERIQVSQFGSDARYDLGAELYELSRPLTAFALQVAALEVTE